MEEPVDDRCNVVYFCAGTQDDVSELFQRRSASFTSIEKNHADAVLDRAYRNVELLLDEDQGGFNEVYMSSCAQQCFDRLDSYANNIPTAVLVELYGKESSKGKVPSKRTDPLSFIRTLSNDVQGARYQQPVMPFALLTTQTPPETLHAGSTSNSLGAGALEVVHNPLEYDDINRLVGHVKETMRPPARLLGASMAQNLVDSIRNRSDPKVAKHRPDEYVQAEKMKAVEDAVSNWRFPAQDFDMDELTYGVLHVLESILSLPDLATYRIPRPQLMTFLLETRRQYKHEKEVHYHNWRHAVDVTQSLYCFLIDAGLCPTSPSEKPIKRDQHSVESLLRPMDGLILLVSAIGHDVGHPGVNNAFLVAAQHPLAQMYNDKSVLENYHCAAYSQLLRRHWPSLSTSDGFRNNMISNILATDMQRHFEYMTNMENLKKKLEEREESLGDWPDKERDQARELIMALLMKAADISNVARPFDVSSRWALILMNEFARQGELENELEIPTCLFGGPPNTEDVLAAAQSQKGFMSLFGFPLFNGMSEIMPHITCAIQELKKNREIWDRKIVEEKARREKGDEGASLTFSSVSKEEVDEAKLRGHKSEPTMVPIEKGQAPAATTKRRSIVDAETATTKHPGFQQRQYLSSGIAMSDEKRSSAPLLPAVQHLGLGGGSRRSSKDVALDQLQHPHLFAHQNLSTGSRRGSADAGWHIQQQSSYPGSRRGSKDESLTTILVTNQGGQGSPARQPSPNSAAAAQKPPGSPGKSGSKRSNLPHSQKQSVRNSIPSAKSQTTGTATATSQHSASTLPSSLATADIPTEDGATVVGNAHEDPQPVPGNWPKEFDGANRESSLPSLPVTPSLADEGPRTDSPHFMSRTATGESDIASRGASRKDDSVLRESRSRSRLRSLKFWKKRGSDSASVTP